MLNVGYVAVPPDSDCGETANYIGVTLDFDKAMAVALVPFHFTGNCE